MHSSGGTGYAGRVNPRQFRERPRRRGRVLVGLVGLGLAASFALTGCFASPSVTGGGTGGSGQSGQGDGTDGGTTTTTPPEQTDLGDFAGLPAGFPTDEIPLIEGEVVFGMDLGTGWTAVVAVDNLTTGFQDASQRLKTAGYTALAESVSADGAFGAFENDTYQVQVTASDNPDYGLTVTYLAVLLG